MSDKKSICESCFGLRWALGETSAKNGKLEMENKYLIVLIEKINRICDIDEFDSDLKIETVNLLRSRGMIE